MPLNALHEYWVENKIKGAWKIGNEKNAELKTHPSIIPFEKFSQSDKKDVFFMAIVCALM